MPENTRSSGSDNNKRHTQAVIIIHGMGEQRPMETLRGFVDTVLETPKKGGEKFLSRPDPLSESFELRVLQNREQPRTHFFEYYWADKVSGTSYKHVIQWLTTLLFRRPNSVPSKLLPIWYISWALVFIAVVAGVFGWLTSISEATTKSTSFIISAVSFLILAGIQGFTLNYVGDVARYLNPAPGNIKIRQDIRADGIKLLKKIHESGIYERVIIVGHSLGSFVAYDILKHVWQEYHTIYLKPEISDQEALRNVEKIGEDLRNNVPGVTLQMYRDAQQNLWKELRCLGNPWQVTDLITLGSPLTYSELLLAKDKKDLRIRHKQRELPICPPEPEDQKEPRENIYSYEVWGKYEGAGKQKIKLRALHSAAHFAVTRWTNFYFPGDLAGGPLTDFGPGVQNLEIRSGKIMVDHTIAAHSSYWDPKIKGNTKNDPIKELVQILDLKNTDYYSGCKKNKNQGDDRKETVGKSLHTADSKIHRSPKKRSPVKK